MTIAVYIPAPDATDPYPKYALQVFTQLAAKKTDHHFIFLSGDSLTLPVNTVNITYVLVKPAIKNRLLQHYVFNFKIPRILNRYNADWFITTEVCSLRTKVNQLLLLTDLSFLSKYSPVTGTERAYLKRFMHAFVKKASGIVILNNSLKPILESKFHVPAAQIYHAPYAFETEYIRNNLPSEAIRADLTDGSEYFLVQVNHNSQPHLLTVIKAFSIFKKWQKSALQLVIAFDRSTADKTVPGLASYKHRKDVKLVDAATHPRYEEVISGSYAIIYLSRSEDLRGAALNMLHHNCPLILSGTAFNQAFYGEAVLYSEVSEKELSSKMMLLYKDEAFRQLTIDRARELGNKCTVAKAAVAFDAILNKS